MSFIEHWRERCPSKQKLAKGLGMVLLDAVGIFTVPFIVSYIAADNARSFCDDITQPCAPFEREFDGINGYKESISGMILTNVWLFTVLFSVIFAPLAYATRSGSIKIYELIKREGWIKGCKNIGTICNSEEQERSDTTRLADIPSIN